ncbi:hypothetical protein ZIOFF_062848 [Zingiber officinale]|uniref:Myb/SANT-like domain-containing protein n=1 Tax=Zingiber officinale TaxID=94328 RepID=A0A8J5F2L9_ZINOF|nr:hypothetical protein ZIOFF_062848 [Zingiber officinale]
MPKTPQPSSSPELIFCPSIGNEALFLYSSCCHCRVSLPLCFWQPPLCRPSDLPLPLCHYSLHGLICGQAKEVANLASRPALDLNLGKYYLVDAGFMLKSSLITPYRGERYHLKEYSRNPPRNARELFNLRHSSLRNAIERTFGVVKKRFAIIRNERLFAEVDVELNNNSEHQVENHSNIDDSEDARKGELLRDSIAATMWMSKKKDLQSNRVGGTFTTHAFENIVNELKAKFSDKLIDKDRIQNRMKHIKRCWFSCYDIFKNGMSGFGWDPITEFFIAEPEVWQQLIEIKLAVAEWKNKPIRNYEKLFQLYGKDRATGQHAETASEMRKRKAIMEMENNVGGHNFETIDEIEFMISQQEIHLDNSNAINEDAQIPSLSFEPTKSQTTSFVGASSKNKSAKKFKVDNGSITNAIDHVAQAIMSSTHEIVKSNELPISEHEVWSLLIQLGVEQHIISTCYLYLVQCPKMLRALLGCPFEHRKNLLFQMLDGENLRHD